MGRDTDQPLIFSALAADEVEVVNGRREKPGPKPKGIRWAKVNAIKATGAGKHCNELLALYRANLEDQADGLRAAGYTTEGLSADDKREIMADARRAWSLPAPPRP